MKRDWMEDLTATEEDRRLLERERVWLMAAEEICNLMEQQNVTRSELARRLEKSPAFVTKILRGTQNLTLGTLSDVFHVLGASVEIRSAPASTIIFGKQSVFSWGARPGQHALKGWVQLKSSLPESESATPGLAA